MRIRDPISRMHLAPEGCTARQALAGLVVADHLDAFCIREKVGAVMIIQYTQESQ